ncbi:unnamed protein product [Boreogadus saida]
MLQLSLPVPPLPAEAADIEGSLVASLREVSGANTKLAFASTPRKVPPASMRDGVPGPYHPWQCKSSFSRAVKASHPLRNDFEESLAASLREMCHCKLVFSSTPRKVPPPSTRDGVPGPYHQLQGQLVRWLEALQGIDFEDWHRAGRLHRKADSLSYWPCDEVEGRHCQCNEG